MGFETWTFPLHMPQGPENHFWNCSLNFRKCVCCRFVWEGIPLWVADLWPTLWRWWAWLLHCSSTRSWQSFFLILGHSLQCYSCINQVDCTSVVNCTHNQDACLYVKAVPLKVYRQCWSLEHCNFEFIANALGEKELHYDCCQKNLCNKSDGTSVSEKTPLLLTLLLVAVCRFYL